MRILQQFASVPVAVLDERLKDQRKILTELMSEEKVLTNDLNCYTVFSGYQEWKETVLAKEKMRLMLKRGTIPAEEVGLHHEIQGQINEIDLLSHSKENIEFDLNVIRTRISEVNKTISGISRELLSKTHKEK